MAENNNKNNGESPVALDDLMVAMDVVDTLRHDEQLASREIDSDARREDLVRRLREIYSGQGIEVPDHLLEEGVKALEDGRFAYEPPKQSMTVWLAKIYVTRQSWGRRLFLWGGIVVVAWFAWLWHISGPPELQTVMEKIQAESRSTVITERARSLADNGLKALKADNQDLARSSLKDLNAMLDALRQSYTVRIVTGKGQKSGVFRIPKANREAKNYYLIVEAVDKSGNVLPLKIRNEETGKIDEVKRWGVRVEKSVFDAVKRDKDDDGIIQNAVVAEKERGFIELKLRMPTLGGSITSW